MIKKILIANRGEIACKLINVAKKMQIKTVAIYSASDIHSPHIQIADEAYYIEENANQRCAYLDIKNIINIAILSESDAIHPGYGFLSENFIFSETVIKNGIKFIGPSTELIRTMSNKIIAKENARKNGLCVIPGEIIEIKKYQNAIKIAENIGYPVIIKSATDGGGRGLKVVNNSDEMHQLLSYFHYKIKNKLFKQQIFIEKFFKNSRHIEIQIIGDKYGNYLHFQERECSIQRNHQKIIEETPSLFLTEDMRNKMFEQSVLLAKNIKYYSVGTIEFIVDTDTNQFYFMEMNARLQVEHSITEMITCLKDGKKLDLVELMIEIECNKKLQINQSDISFKGWAFESRIYAEDPDMNFAPSTGKITHYLEPEKREFLDIYSGIQEGCDISPIYEGMMIKVCTYGKNRNEALNNMKNILNEYVISGISHNLNLLHKIYSNKSFIEGNLSTNFIEKILQYNENDYKLLKKIDIISICISAYILNSLNKQKTTNKQEKQNIEMDGAFYSVTIENKNTIIIHDIDQFCDDQFLIATDWKRVDKIFKCKINEENYIAQVTINYSRMSVFLSLEGNTKEMKLYTQRTTELLKYIKNKKKENNTFLNKEIRAKISGIIKNISVSVGDFIQKDQQLLILEAMKMENIILSPFYGKIEKIYISKNELVSSGQLLITLTK